MKAAIGLVVFVLACAALAFIAVQAEETYPQEAGSRLQAAPDGYPLTKCKALNANNEPDSVVAPLGYRIARVDITQRVGDAADEMYVAIKQAYHGTHLDSFPVDGSAARVASQSSGTTILWMKAFSNGTVFEQAKETIFPNTDKVYFDTITDADSDSEWSWCAYLVAVSNDDRASVSTIDYITEFLDR
jgi:hypothetical protein